MGFSRGHRTPWPLKGGHGLSGKAQLKICLIVGSDEYEADIACEAPAIAGPKRNKRTSPIRTNPSPMVENQQRVDQSLEPKCSQDCFECLPVFAGEV